MATTPSGTTPATAALQELTRLIERAARELGDAGHSESASTITASAWAAIREQLPKEATRLTGIVHRLTNSKSGGRLPARPPHAESPELDVRNDPPARRHQLIFEAYHALDPGTGFILVNDHDPKPLYYQFAAEYPDAFEWEPLEEGPVMWRVYIGSRYTALAEPVTVPLADLQGIATMVIEGLRIRGFEKLLLTDADAILGWERLQEVMRDGTVKHAEAGDLARILAAVERSDNVAGGS